MQHAKLCSLMLLLAVLGCVRTNAVMLGTPGHLAPVSPDEVQVFLTEADVKGEYDKVALINAKGESSWTNEAKMIKAMQKKAAALGANGIILGEIKEPGAGAKIAGALLGTGAERKGKVVAIRLKDANQ